MTEPGDAASWVETARARLERAAQLAGFEIRAGTQRDRKLIRRAGTIRTSGAVAGTGLSVRAYHGAGVGFAYTNELDARAVHAAVDAAVRLAESHSRLTGRLRAAAPDTARRAHYETPARLHPDDAPPDAAYALLARAEEALRAAEPEARTQAAFGYRTHDTILADSAGSWVTERRLHSTLLVQTVLRDGSTTSDGNAWLGGSRGLKDYEEEGGPEALADRAAREAREGLAARTIAPGRYRVLTDSHLTGIMAHESFGHLTEYDLVASGWSVLAGREGERLARPGVTIRDDPLVGDGRDGAAVPFDNEGTPGRPVTLLDDGVLRGFLHARGTAGQAETAPTGNARAIGVHNEPIVRMRNTYVAPGELTVEEAIEALGTGVYLFGGRGGSPRADGSFMFTSQRGYWVENGRIQHPIKLASIYGNVLDFLQHVEGLTRDVRVTTTYFGGCGKWDQSFLHVGMGGPHVLVSEALIGGQGGAGVPGAAAAPGDGGMMG